MTLVQKKRELQYCKDQLSTYRHEEAEPNLNDLDSHFKNVFSASGIMPFGGCLSVPEGV